MKKERLNSQRYALGLDLGGTKILVALLSQEGKLIKQIESPTLAKEGERAVTERIIHSLETLINRSQVPIRQIGGIGVGVAGVIDPEQNKVVHGPNLDWHNVPLGALLEEHFNLPVTLANDANVAALSEWLWGAGKGKSDLIYITVSTGIGAGIISGNKLLTGVSNNAGEFGHLSIIHNGLPCSCGNRGCIERYASGTAMAHVAQERLRSEINSSSLLAKNTPELSLITAKEIGQAAASGDPFALSLFEETAYYLGVGLTNLIHLFNPELIIFGGGVMLNNAHLLLPQIEKVIQERCFPNMSKDVRLGLSILGREAGAIGAAGLILLDQEV